SQHRAGVCGVRRAPEKFAHFGRKRLCATRETHVPSSADDDRIRAFGKHCCRTAGTLRGCARERMHAHAIFKTRLFSALSSSTLRDARSASTNIDASGARSGRVRWRECAGRRAENFSRGELTAEKTVIRFRPTDGCKETSESAHGENEQQT